VTSDDPRTPHAPRPAGPARRDLLLWTGALTAAAATGGWLGTGTAQAATPAAASAATPAASTFSPLRPPAVPLAVRSPYLSTWVAADNLAGTWSTFWNGHITALCGLARIDGTGYVFTGDHYAAVCALALRQAVAGTELVDRGGSPWAFLKEISSDGNVSTIDVTYPAFPAYLYLSPAYLRLLLEPLLDYAEHGG
jgi:hypothetical protein